MNNGRKIALLVALPVLVLALVLLLGDWQGVQIKTTDLACSGALVDDSAPLEMPAPGDEPLTSEKPSQPSDEPVNQPSKANDAETSTGPVLDVPDYGPAIHRGGAYLDLELYDAAGARVPVQDYGAKLWRKVGSYWLADEVSRDRDANLIRCDGLGGEGATPAGLEPGSFEVELFSSRWGNFRHEFSVTRGERRTDRLTVPHTRAIVQIRFVDQDGMAIPYLPALPKNMTSVTALDVRAREAAKPVYLRRPPTEALGGSGFSGWRSSPSGRYVPRRVRGTPLYPTDNGSWWVLVYAGATNTITFPLEESLWGQTEVTVTDTFVSRDKVEVTLNVQADFKERAEEWGEVIDTYEPGRRNLRDGPAVRDEPAPFDPYNAPVKDGKVRLVVETSAPVTVRVEISLNGIKPNIVMQGGDGVHWSLLRANRTLWVRLVDGRLLCTPWQKVVLGSGGVQTMMLASSGSPVRVHAGDLSPTLRAFAHMLELSAYPMDPPQPTEEGDTIIEDASDRPGMDLAENTKDDTPRPLFKVQLESADGLSAVSVNDNPALNDEFHGLSLQTELRGVCRYTRGISGSASAGPDGRHWFEPVRLRVRVDVPEAAGKTLAELLQSGALQPRLENVLVARAVGPAGEGLPWVRGTIIEYEQDEVAQQVRGICAQQEVSPVTTGERGKAYAKRLESLETEEDFRALMGDSYDLFDTTEQRLWFARHGAWYDTGRAVYADDQGYIAVRSPSLEADKCYVLYLWSNSRDDRHPDARFAFRVDEHGVADLGAIHMPTFKD